MSVEGLKEKVKLSKDVEHKGKASVI